ncbi:hypothetical protein AB1Y20_020875 [Prymnesium parvum]|uniref:Ceramide glucosyltransferase n=1 Tax=Prymnesium parvum TaxID=97485 RepID=A0AB34JWH2_PRYPA
MDGEGETVVVTAAGWLCFASLLSVDVAFIVGFLEYSGAINLWDAAHRSYGDEEMTALQWLYFGVMCVCNTVVSLIIFSLAGAFGKRLLNKRKLAAAMSQDHERRLSNTTGVTVLLPCYLPNEQVILRDTMTHILEKIEYPQPFELVLCYNTPKPLAIEDELAQMDGKVFDNGRILRVLRVEGSRSKAENLNAALDLVGTENVVIYDADHHADPKSLMIAAQYMKLHNCHCVQGSTYIRYKPTLLSRMIDAEFFVIFFCFFPAIQFLTRVGIFGGSNALWKTDVLRKYQFRTNVATEDVDLSTRVILGNIKIRFCPEARSGELPPASFRALWRQRLRWEIGWDQVSMQHFKNIYRAKDLKLRKKLALYYWLPWRWLMLTTSAINAFVTPLVTTIVPPETFGFPLRIMMDVSVITFVVVTSFVVCNAVVIAKPREWFYIVVFQLLGMFYLLWNATIVTTSLFRIATGLAGGHGFVPTERDATGTKTHAAEGGIAMEVSSVAEVSADSAGTSSEPQEGRSRTSTTEGRSRATTTTARAVPDPRKRAESAFGWQFAAPEDLESVELRAPPQPRLTTDKSPQNKVEPV